MLVRMRMTKNPISVSPDTSILEAWKIMQNSQIRRLLVMDKGKLVGIVTERDLRSVSPSQATSLSIFEINYLLEKLKVKDAMTPNPITVDADAPIEEAALIMRDNKISALPVIENGEVVGIITESDVFRAFIEMLGDGKKGLRYTLRIKNNSWRDCPYCGSYSKGKHKYNEYGNFSCRRYGRVWLFGASFRNRESYFCK